MSNQSQQAPPSEKRPRVLLVATDGDEREALARPLRQRDLHVQTAASVVQAFEMLKEPIDIVIADMNLGNTSGSEFVTYWRRENPRTRFLMIATAASEEQCVETLRAGADAYLRLPLNTDELTIRIDRSLADLEREDRLHELTARLDADPAKVPATRKLHELEREAIEQALEQHQGNRTHAADALGISVRTLQRKIKAWGLAPPRDGRSG